MNIDKIIKESVNLVLENEFGETSRRQKAKQAIYGKNSRVSTIAIISPQNPMGQKMPDKYNKDSMNEFIEYLERGHYKYFKVDGMYQEPEKSVMIFNISLKDAVNFAYNFNQESMVFIERDGENMSYQYWEGDDHYSPLKKQYERHEIIDATNDDDFYTKISRMFKFRIPFFECVSEYENLMNERSKRYDVNRLIAESMSDKYTGYHRYVCRGKLYGKLNEYVSMVHSNHNMNDFLDDDDFLRIVDKVKEMYGPEDFEGDTYEIERYVADLINEFISDEALDDFGYKYGSTNYNKVALDVVEYIKEHLSELY